MKDHLKPLVESGCLLFVPVYSIRAKLVIKGKKGIIKNREPTLVLEAFYSNDIHYY
ncbi:hypothetical protein MSP8887_01105 [Marinomonas spartinae]|uniref:Uncharacterized protein n=1 Tax=Marinomonas spartinae TaxID=1792290 RepID=A0A1A8TR57_9GAMM|nr:hypothetical protein MSP8887_01105 [Marinomonas spartinae]SBS36950.1 hypothetical protein MSP8886_03914 [Marinomonas spartinae]